MKIIISVFIGIGILSCTQKPKGSYEEFILSEEDYVSAFKICVFYGCLNKATDGNFQKFLMGNNDLGLATEVSVLYHSVVNDAESIGADLSENIEPIDYADYEGRTPVFSGCAYYAFKDEQIDSIAKAYFKKTR